MNISKLMADISNKKTWIRVVELNRIGYFKDKGKRVLFGAPIPQEDKLPLGITIILGFIIMAVIIVIASGALSLPVNILRNHDRMPRVLTRG